MGNIINEIVSLVSGKSMKSLLGLKSDIKTALDIMCTTNEMDAKKIRFDVGDNMKYWPDIIAMRKNTNGGKLLNITTDSNGLITGISENGTPKVDSDGNYEYFSESVSGKKTHESFIPYDPRAWDKVGFDYQPSSIGENVEYIESAYVRRWKANGFNTSTATDSGYFDNDFKESCVFLPDLIRLGIDTSGVKNWSNAFSSTSIVIMPEKIDTSGATDVTRMFENSVVLSKTPQIDISNCNSIYSICSGMSSLREVQKMKHNKDTIYNFSYAFNSCTSLENLDTTKIFDGIIKVGNIDKFILGKAVTVNMSNCLLVDNCAFGQFLYNQYTTKKLTLRNIPQGMSSTFSFRGSVLTDLYIYADNTDGFQAVNITSLKNIIVNRGSNMTIHVRTNVMQQLTSDNDFFSSVIEEGSEYNAKNIKIELW